ncbi:B-cell linker protein-like protein, partial [Leptotrombidium deliense]
FDDDDNASWGSEFDDYFDDDDESDDDSSRCGNYSFTDDNSHLRQQQLKGIMATNFDSTYESVYETPPSSSSGENSENSSSIETACETSEISDANANQPSVVLLNRKTTLRECFSSQSLPETCISNIESKYNVIDNNSNCCLLSKSSTSFSEERCLAIKPSLPVKPTKPLVPPKPATLSKAVPKNNAEMPEVPKNDVEVTRRMKTKKIVRPPSEPPPPPLPKSPPPVSTGKPLFPEITLSELSQVLEPEQDGYEPPIFINQENSPRPSSTTSSQNRSSDSDSGSGYLPFRVSPPPGFDDTYEPMMASVSTGSTPNLNILESNYEEVPEDKLSPRERFLGSTISLTSTAELNRPKLPRVKLSSSSSLSLKFPEKLKLIPEKLMKSEKSLSNIDHRSQATNGLNSLNPAHRPLPPVPPKDLNAEFNAEMEILRTHPWFHDIERDEAAVILQKMNEGGGYVVRAGKRAGKSNPFSLTIFHDNKIFHLNIRRRQDGLFALGKFKEREKTFRTVPDLIFYHQKEPILLTTKGKPAGTTKLSKTPQR